jgi:hypothetical protein
VSNESPAFIGEDVKENELASFFFPQFPFSLLDAPYARTMPKLSREIATELLGRVSEVALIHGVVAFEHGPGLVAGEGSGFPDSGDR